MINILILVTGSVAAIKLPLLLDKLLKQNGSSVEIRVVLTESSMHFFQLDQIRSILPPGSIFRDQDEWDQWKTIGDPVIHIDLRSWADIGIIAPLDANTMGKIANGICDNLVSCVMRAWDMSKPMLVAPAMNVHMWNHPLTERSLRQLADLGYIQIGPISKKLACGDIGMGAMAEVDQIVDKINELIRKQADLTQLLPND